MSSTDFEVHVDEPEVLVVGAGQAGLAIGYELRERDLSFQIVDAADEIGAVWRSRWDSLRLFTADQYNSLPGMDFPAAADTYPGKEVADFLRAYVARFDLPVRLNTRVHSLSKAAGGYLADTNNGALAAREVVVATGPFQAPHIPPIADRLAPDVAQMHSSGYRTLEEIDSGPALVVGGGNIGFQIAEELSGRYEVHLSIGSWQTPLPQRLLGLGRRLSGRETSSDRRRGPCGAGTGSRSMGGPSKRPDRRSASATERNSTQAP